MYAAYFTFNHYCFLAGVVDIYENFVQIHNVVPASNLRDDNGRLIESRNARHMGME